MKISSASLSSGKYSSSDARAIGARSICDIMDVSQIPLDERKLLARVGKQYPFRATSYYLGLIDWSDKNDPIRKIVIPETGELNLWGGLDASDEASVTQIHGVQHKYPDTALLLVTDSCVSFCRYCFRKRLFKKDNIEARPDISRGLEYARNHREITNILITGGDPLTLSTRRIKNILTEIREIPHIKMIRIGSKSPAFNPWRLSDDQELQDCFREFLKSGKQIYLMTHFDHPKELTAQAVREVRKFQELGVICANQCPIIRGVNDSSSVLRDLYFRLSSIGCVPYYLFQGRPTAGNAEYRVPIVETYNIFHAAIKNLCGLAKVTRFVMSHSTGKLEIVGVDDTRIYARYHRAKNPLDRERFVIFHRDDEAYWPDDLEEMDSMSDQGSFCANNIRY